MYSYVQHARFNPLYTKIYTIGKAAMFVVVVVFLISYKPFKVLIYCFSLYYITISLFYVPFYIYFSRFPPTFLYRNLSFLPLTLKAVVHS